MNQIRRNYADQIVMEATAAVQPDTALRRALVAVALLESE